MNSETYAEADPVLIDWIDNASYEELLRRWRNAPVGDPIFTGATGAHYSKVMSEKRAADQAGHVAASKAIGWDR